MARRSAAALVACLVLGACSGGGSDDTTSTSAAGAPAAQVAVVSQNLLHGIACPADSDGCDLPARVDLFVDQLAADCPQIVGVQEANQRTVDLLRSAVTEICGGAYAVVWGDDEGVDREVVLTTETVLGSRRIRLAGPLRTALWVRVASDVGVVDFVSSHLASSSDDRPCDSEACPPPCLVTDRLNTCQGRQLAAFALDMAATDGVLVVAGDLNAEPDDPTMAAIRDAGFVDTHIEAGNPECDPETGAACTSGRIDDALTDLTDPTSRQSERIDYVLVAESARTDRACEVIAPTGLFNADPATTTPGALAFPADHTGVVATVSCPTTEAQRTAAAGATVPTDAPTTTVATDRLDEATIGGVTTAFTNLFDGSVADIEVKLASLEDADLLRESFLESFERTQAIASRITVRMDSLERIDDAHVAVTYSLLLDGAAVLDHLPGVAVLVDGAWKVSRRTYCEVSTQGATTIPEPCR